MKHRKIGQSRNHRYFRRGEDVGIRYFNGSSSSGDTTIRYAPWLETAAQDLILTGFSALNNIIYSNPYVNFVAADPNAGFFGDTLIITSFPSVYDMFTTYMNDVDIEALWTQLETDSLYGTAISEAVAASGAELDDQIVTYAYPRMEAGMRDMNAVMTSTFLINREIIEADKVRVMGKLQSDLHLGMLSLGQQRWAKHLEWNSQVVSHYLSINHTYYNLKTQYLSEQMMIDTGKSLWQFTVLDHQRALVGVLNGAHAAAVKKDPGFNKTISGALGIASLLTAPMTGGLSATVGGAAIGALTHAMGTAQGTGVTVNQ